MWGVSFSSWIIKQSFGWACPRFESNSVGDLVGLALGSEPGTDPATASSEAFDQSASLAADAAVHVGVHALPQVAVGTVTSIGTPVSYATGAFNPVTVGETSVSLGSTAAGSLAVTAAELALVIKMGADIAIFGEALAVCSLY
jgi:hypothetical protein